VVLSSGVRPVTEPIAAARHLADRARRHQERFAADLPRNLVLAADRGEFFLDPGFECRAGPEIVERMLKVARARPGAMLVTGLPMSIVVTCRLDAWKCSVPAGRAVLAVNACSSATSRCRRVVDEMRVGDMALHAFDGEPPGHAAAAAELDHVAEVLRRGRLADDAGVERLTALPQPIEYLSRAVDRRRLLVTGDQEAESSRRKPGPRTARNRSAAAMNAAIALFMSDRAAAAQLAAAQGCGKRLERPALGRAGWHHVGMAPAKKRLGPAAAETGVEVDNRRGRFAVGAGVVEDQAMAGEPEPFEAARDDVERALVVARDAGAADQLGCQFDRIDRPIPRGGVRRQLAHSRSNSLIEVRARGLGRRPA